MKRTVQDLLAERRSNLNEMRRENDATARETLRAHVAQLDVEIAALNAPTAISYDVAATTRAAAQIAVSHALGTKTEAS